jgi:hypothetical protein
VRRLLRTRLTKRTGPAARTGRLSGRWFAALLVIGVLGLLAPGVRLVTAPAAHAAAAAPAAVSAEVGCQGVTPAVIPAVGFITNPSRAQAGHLWWRSEAGGVCIGTVIEWVQYNAPATKNWRVIVYSAQHPGGQVVAQRTFTLGPGWYWWSFGVHQVFAGLSAVCVTADDSFGVPCLHFGT